MRLGVVLVACLVVVPASADSVGVFDEHGDVGSPKNAGSARYNAVSQEYTLSASGANMWAQRDEFHFVWKKLTGNFILQARVELLGAGVDPHRKLGLMVRPSLDADAPYADVAVHGDGLSSLQFRRSKGAITDQLVSAVTKADVIQFERRGNRYLFSAARYGDPYTATELADFELGDDVYVGLFLCSHNADVIEKAIFRDVRVIRPVKEGFTPYRDYIGSQLEVLDVASGHRQVLKSSAQPFEAPNWTPDGLALVVNSSGRSDDRGRLHRFDLATRQTSVIDTAFANRNNNDHVLSFDGSMFGISEQSAPGGSAVYTVPIAGGTPKRITPLQPSYLHGWSPDGKWLVYTGGRKDHWDIYRIASDGSGEEVRLTDYAGRQDGPEYSPDGKHIYFNSTRSGRMQLWRMKPDGKDPEQLTNDEYNNWFPHVSPDGQWIAFLSYGQDVGPEEHPYYKHTYLRLMPVGGGPARVIAYVYGGQGTINVPSWSPDSRMLAFVGNTDLP